MTLYVPAPADCGHGGCTRANEDYLLEYADPATPREIVAALGDVCVRCGGAGSKDHNVGGADSDWRTCVTCNGAGRIIPERVIEAALVARLAPDVQGLPGEMTRVMLEAALTEWAKGANEVEGL